MALSGVTDAYGKGPDHAERMRAVTKVVVTMLRSWSGMPSTIICWTRLLTNHATFRADVLLPQR